MAKPSEAQLGAACADWERALGPGHVIREAAPLRAAATATFATSARVCAIIRPSSTDEVRESLRIATRHGVPVYPTSRGANWGLGSRVPVKDAVLLDLGRMEAITDYDDELGCVSVQPGVTFQSLFEFLKRNSSRHSLNVIGGSPHASVLANALERGDGSGPNAYRFDHVANLEVVLPSGELLHTGFGRWGSGDLGALHRYGVGPSLDGLFSQSNLGVVTRITLWLARTPNALAAIRFRFRDAHALAPVVDAIRDLRREGTLRSGSALSNDLRVLSTSRQYPWELTGGRTPISAAERSSLRDELGGVRWFGLSSVFAASPEQRDANVARVRARLAPLVEGLDVTELDGDRPADGQFGPEPAFKFLLGMPHEASMRSMYFRKRGAIPSVMKPDQDDVGVLWACPTAAFRGADVERAVELLESVFAEHGFEPLLVIAAPVERVVFPVPLIIYDRAIEGEDERALACHDDMLSKLVADGFLPHRLGIQSMNALPKSRDDFDLILHRLKRLLDPALVLAPGRYDFGAESD